MRVEFAGVAALGGQGGDQAVPFGPPALNARAAALLERVGELVGQQVIAGLGAGLLGPGAEIDVGAVREGLGAQALVELRGLGIRVRYLHSDIHTLERVSIIRDLRLGEFDVLVGVNLLREGLDIPEVSLVAILDAEVDVK